MKKKDWLQLIVGPTIVGLILLVAGKGCDKSNSLVDKEDLGKLACALCSNGSIHKGDTICFEYKCALSTSFNLNNQTYSATVVSSRPIEVKRTRPVDNAVTAPAFVRMTAGNSETIELPVRNHYQLKAQSEPLKVIDVKDGTNKPVPEQMWVEILRELQKARQPVQLRPKEK